MVLFDLPGTMGSDGVIAAISSLDYLFVPIKADRLVLESTLNFATTINDRLIKTGVSALKSLHLFWNMVDRRERTTLYDVYQQGFSLLGLDCLKTRIPVRSNFTKDLSATGGSVYRSTLFAPDAAFTKECGFDTFMDEIISILKT
ncbi:Conjugative transposon protein TraA [Bacteroides ovatus]|nr:Conjugative transposon protein TraA [Bacteroides ovatus]